MDKPIKDLSQLKGLFPGMENYQPEESSHQEEEKEENLSAKDKAQMKLYVSRDKKQRGGKQVTLVQGHEGPLDEMTKLLSRLKSLWSAGGSLKDDELIIQGDHVQKVIDFLM